MKYSAFQVLWQGLRGHKGWKRVWRDPEPKPRYDVIIIGGGGHGLATAYYLAKEHGITNVAVIEKGWIGGGNVGRNTTIVRSNYMLPANTHFYEKSMKLWEGLEQDLNFNAMVSQRGVINLFHSDPQRDAFARRGNAMRMAGVDAELLSPAELKKMVPILDFENARFPIQGGLIQRRGGTVRHDAVAWGYARGADSRGVDIIQNCEVKDIIIEGGRAVGVHTSKGTIKARKVGMAVAGHTTPGCQNGRYQTAGRKPCAAGLRFGRHQAAARYGRHLRCRAFLHQPVGQGRAGLGGDLDGYNSYAQRGNLPMMEHVMAGGMAIMPAIGRVRCCATGAASWI